MSLWRPERVRVALHRDRAALVRLPGRMRTRAATALCAFPEGTNAEQMGSRLAEVFALPEWRGATVEVVLSHALCRLALVPGGINVRGRDEESALFRSCVEEANGELPPGWQVVVAEAPAHRSRPVCAVEGALIAALDSAAAAGGGRIVSVRPLLVDAYNAHHSVLASGRQWLVVAERERACLARLSDGEFVSLRVYRLFSDVAAEVGVLLRKELFLSGDDPAPEAVRLCAPNLPGLRLPAGGSPMVSVLEGRRPPAGHGLDAGDYGMALEGLA